MSKTERKASLMTDNEKELLKRAYKVLSELHAMVKGECRSLLNEDSGGNGQLDIDIEDVLEDLKGFV